MELQMCSFGYVLAFADYPLIQDNQPPPPGVM